MRNFQELTNEEIDLAAKECIQYLEENLEFQALRVLNGPNTPKDFGPFFKPIIVGGVTTTGQEVIGRIWRFIQTLSDLEKQNALISLVAELNQCINEDDERICNEVKMQRIFIGVLQGRLEGVEIDDWIEIPKKKQKEEEKAEQGESSLLAASRMMSKQDAVNRFFSDAKHKAIADLEELLRAANEFLEQNSGHIDRDKFIKQIKKYAALSNIK